MINSVPTEPCRGETFVIVSTEHVVDTYSSGLDETITDDEHWLTFNTEDDEHEEFGIDTIMRWISWFFNEMKWIPVGVQYNLCPEYVGVGEHHNWVSLTIVHEE